MAGATVTRTTVVWANAPPLEVGDQFTVGELIYEVTGEGAVEVADTTSISISGDLVIPSMVSDGSTTYNVASIGDGAFLGCSELTSITIPEVVTSIGSSAFYNCFGLTSITIPDGVTNISSSAFYCCSGLTSITIPDGVTSIGGEAFLGCSGLTSITIPSNVTTIAASAFLQCIVLTSVTFESESAPTFGMNSFLTGTKINVYTPGWDPTQVMKGGVITSSVLPSSTVVWANPPYPDLIFESDPEADGIVAWVSNRP